MDEEFLGPEFEKVLMESKYYTTLTVHVDLSTTRVHNVTSSTGHWCYFSPLDGHHDGTTSRRKGVKVNNNHTFIFAHPMYCTAQHPLARLQGPKAPIPSCPLISRGENKPASV